MRASSYVVDILGDFSEYSTITGNNTLIPNNKYIVNTSASPSILTLPSAESKDEIIIFDQKGTFASKNCTLTSTEKINGQDNDIVINLKGIKLTLVYVNPTVGWNISDFDSKYFKNIEVDSSNKTDGYVLQYNQAANKLEMVVFGEVTPSPVLSGPSSGDESSNIPITIDNYNSSTTYTISVDDGSWSRTGDVITWTLPNVDQPMSSIMRVTASSLEYEPSIETTKQITILNLPLLGDDAIVVEGTDFNTWGEELNNVVASGKFTATDASGTAMSVPELQESGDSDLGKVHPKVRVKTTTYDVINGNGIEYNGNKGNTFIAANSNVITDEVGSLAITGGVIDDGYYKYGQSFKTTSPVILPNSTNFDLGSDDFTVDTWMNFRGEDHDFGDKFTFNSTPVEYTYTIKLDSTRFLVFFKDVNNSNYGTVMIGTTNGNSITYGSKFIFNSGISNYISAVLVDSTHFVVAYQDNSNGDYGTAIVGTITGASITFGSEYVFNNGNTQNNSIVKVESNKICISYRDGGNSSYGTSRIGTIYGTTITWGSKYVFNSTNTTFISTTLLDSTHICISYRDNGNSEYGTSIIGTISGTTITFGSEYVFNSSITYNISTISLDSTHFCVSYTDIGNSYYGTSRVGTVSGTTITWGNKYVFNSGDTNWVFATKIDDTHFCVAYQDAGNSSFGTTIIGTLSGANIISFSKEYVFNYIGTATLYISTTLLDVNKVIVAYSNNAIGISQVINVKLPISKFGSKYVFNNGNTPMVSSALIDSTHFVVAYQDNSNSNYGTARIGTINNGVITYGDKYVFNNATIDYVSVTRLTDTTALVVYQDFGNNYYGTARVLAISGTTITIGAKHVFNSAVTGYNSITRLTDTTALVTYRDNSNISGTAHVLTVSGTTVSSGTKRVFNSSDTHWTSVTMLTANIALVAYQDTGNNSYGTACVLTISGTTITSGTEYVFNTASTINISVAKLTDSMAIIVYRDDGNSGYGASIIGTISGATITWGSEYTLNESATTNISINGLDSTHVCVSYRDDGNLRYGTIRIGTISGTTISWGSKYVFNQGEIGKISTLNLDGKSFLINYQDVGLNGYGTSIIGTMETLLGNFSFSNSNSQGWWVKIYKNSLGNHEIKIKSPNQGLYEYIIPVTITNPWWNHVAITRSDDTGYVFLNGELVDNINLAGVTFNSSGNGLKIGGTFIDNLDEYSYINVENFRVVKGSALWTSNFNLHNTTNVNSLVLDSENITTLSNGDTVLLKEADNNIVSGTINIKSTESDAKKSTAFATVTYTGTGSNQSITGLGFQPDFVWIKGRDQVVDNRSYDSVLGANKRLNPNLNVALVTHTTEIQSFDSDGFTIGDSNGINGLGYNYVAWCWKADNNIAPIFGPEMAINGTFDTDVSGWQGSGIVWNNGVARLNYASDTPVYVEINTEIGEMYEISVDVTYVYPIVNMLLGHTWTDTNNNRIAPLSWTWPIYDSTWKTLLTPSAGSFKSIYRATGTVSRVAFQTGGNTVYNEIDNVSIRKISGGIGDDGITRMESYSLESGLSIIKYTGNGAGSRTIAHSLGKQPKVVIIKNLSAVANWVIGAQAIDSSYSNILILNGINTATTSATTFNNTAPSTTHITLGNDSRVNTNGQDYIAYVFTDISLFNTFGSYTGNGNSTGPVVNLGFRPSYVMIKGSNISGNWQIYDNKRGTYNPNNTRLLANSNAIETEQLVQFVDFTETGFQIKSTSTELNNNGSSYIYWAFRDKSDLYNASLVAPAPSTPMDVFSNNPDLHMTIGTETEYIPMENIQLSNLSAISLTGLTGESDKDNLWVTNGNHKKIGLTVNGSSVETNILTVSKTGSGPYVYTVTFAQQLSNPSGAWKPQVLGSVNTKLTPESKTYVDLSESIEMQYQEIDFETSPNIRQLKFFMDFNKTNDQWIYLYADLYKKP